jgi:hypothetical protein
MTRFHFSTALAIASVCLTPLAFGQQPREKPKELEILGQYVGDWTSDVTGKPAVWTPEEKKFKTSNHAEFVLDGWFLHHIEVTHEVSNPIKVGKSLFLWTFDPKTEMYTEWLFQSSGVIGKWVGTWNPRDKSLTATSPDLPPMTTGKFVEAFPNDSTINGTLVFTGNDGKTLFDMVWTRKRQAGVAGQPTQERWSKIGTPVEPIPTEVKKLNVFIGEWDSEFLQRPSAVSPNGNTSTGTMTGQWILDGRFLFGTSEVGNHNSKWVIGYDTNKEAYRYIRFTNTGQIDESIGQWNEETRSFVWKLVNAPSGITRTSTNRIVGNDAIHAHILAEKKDGTVHMDLSIRTTRQK